MKRLLLVGFLSGASVQAAERESFIQLDKFSLQINRFTCNVEYQTPDIPCSQYLGRVSTNFDLSIGDYLFWRNTVHGEGTHSKFMTVGWHWEFGVNLIDGLQLFYEHHSQHVMDRNQPYFYDKDRDEVYQKKFPVEDSIGLSINIIDRIK